MVVGRCPSSGFEFHARRYSAIASSWLAPDLQAVAQPVGGVHPHLRSEFDSLAGGPDRLVHLAVVLQVARVTPKWTSAAVGRIARAAR